MVYKVYGITQGEKEVDLSVSLPEVVPPGTKGRISYYMWCIKGEKTALLVDTGMDDEDAKKRNLKGEEYLRDRLKKIGVNPADVEIVIVSHLHADHFSAYGLYPKARFYIQRKDMEFFTGPAVMSRQVTQFAANIPSAVSLAYGKRVQYLDGDEQIAPGIRVLLLGGHTPGSQAVVVTTSRGEVVLCFDIMDFYRNLEEGVFGHSLNLMQSLSAWEKVKAVASSPELIIPGHDPLVMQRFPNPMDGVVEIG